tara:strand:- start:1037 stop:3277 length:2241 start_codon:yes stop_codon:yes gene_type:complete
MPRYKTSGIKSTIPALNTELEKIAISMAELFSRTGETPNQLSNSLDMNNNQLINLPFPSSASSPLRLGDFDSNQSVTIQIPQGFFNVVTYGAVGDNATDNLAAFTLAIDALESAGGGILYIPKGTFRINGRLRFVNNMTIRGEGYNSCVKNFAGRTTDNTIWEYFPAVRPSIGIRNLRIEHVRFEGIFDETFTEHGTNGLLIIVGVENVSIEDCYFKWSNSTGINCNQCENFYYNRNLMQYIARDCAAIWNTPNTRVTNSTFIGNDDDCISINRSNFELTNNKVRDAIIIQGNYLRDSGGIRCQSPKNCVIDSNVVHLTKGNAGISIEGINTLQDRMAPVNNLIISNNMVTDTLDRLLSREPNPNAINGAFRIGIKISGAPVNAGSLAAIPGTFDTNGNMVAPYEYYYTESGDSNELPVRHNSGILVQGNVVKRTQGGGGILYSSMGFGKMFSRFFNSPTATPAPAGYVVDGFADPLLSASNFECRPLEIRDGMQYSTIQNNMFEGGGDECIRIRDDKTPAADWAYRELLIKDNILRDFRSKGINIDQFYGGTKQGIRIEGNTIDGDPYFQDTAARGKDANNKFDGTWVDVSTSLGLAVALVDGIEIKWNSFKNLANPISQGVGVKNDVYENTYYGKPVAGVDVNTFSASSGGIGLYPSDVLENGRLVYIETNPQSSNYGNMLVKRFDSVTSTAPPTEGYYFRGEFVPSRSQTIVGGKLPLGLRKLTSGTGVVAGTDWQVIYGTTT